ncbi:MAG: domain S-box-containing protein [Xanthobacteraceae bacterium]|nr:domain S-box-containing protein [Xanthobacteraceae bacterium]
MTYMLPPNEIERLKALHDLKINGSQAVPTFDDICRLALDYFGVPIALVTLVDSDVQHFKGRCGTDLTGTPRDVAFCSHAILSDDVLVVEDASTDPRFATNPLVTGEPHIRFYAGAPLVLRSGVRLGTVCVIDRQPRKIGAGECEALKRFANLAVEALRHREANLRAQSQQAELDRQQSVLAQAEDIAPGGIWEWELESGWLQWSDGIFRLLGLEPGSLKLSYEFFLSMVHPDDRAAVDAACRATRDQLAPFAMKFGMARSDGQVRTLVCRGEVLKQEDDRPLRAVGLVRDVTMSDLADEALRANEARWRHALQAGQMIAFDVDIATGLTTLSDHAHELVGLQSGYLQDFINLVHCDDRGAVEAALQRVIQNGSPYQVEFRFIRPDGQLIWLSQAGGLTPRTDDRPPRLAGVCFNVTERKKLESSLQKSEARFRDFAEVSSDWLWETDDQLRLTHLGAPRQVFGMLETDAVGKTRWEVAGADLDAPNWKEHIQDHKALRSYRDFEFQIPDEASKTRHIVSSGRPFFDQAGRFLGYRGTSSDQTARKELEAQLQQAVKMEAIGHLTGGVAHDFNNLLTIIFGNAEILVENLWADDELRPLAELILTTAKRGADLTYRLLAFARRETLEPTALSVNATVEGMLGMLRHALGEQIILQTDLGSDVAPAFVDSSLLETAILNLAVNARDAMPTGGTLTIKTKNVAVVESAIDLNAGSYVALSVTDTGHGMAPDLLRRALEPFFTTKAVGKGSGLGLPMAYGFAKQSGGHLAITSEPGQGTTVRLMLPLADGKLAPEKCSQESVTSPSGTERILIVEDEQDVLRFVGDQLEKLGYLTRQAADGAAALALLNSGTRFDLLFTDMVLPGRMNGLEIAEAARKLQPGLKVLFTSGYSTDVLAQEGLGEQKFRLLRKPYQRHELAAALRQALDSETADMGTFV